MTPKVAKKVSGESAKLFRQVRKMVDALPDDLDLGADEQGQPIALSCHILSRAIRVAMRKGYYVSLPQIDGKYSVGFSHSWLLTPDHQWIIDAYPVGIASGPTLVDNRRKGMSPGAILYKKDRKMVANMRFSSMPFRQAVRTVTVELIRIIGEQRATKE